jgi:Fe-S oxidoreductase
MGTYLSKEEIEKLEKAGFKVYLGICPICGNQFTKDYPKTDDGWCLSCDMDSNYGWI